MDKSAHKLKYVFRALLGILFLFSATAKLISIDSFEIYLFSFKVLSLGFSFLAARLIIAAEYFLGILLLANFWPKAAFWCSAAMLAGFSIFLAVLVSTGSSENCNCFGDLVEMDPKQSLVKNIALLSVLLFSAGCRPFSIRWKPLWGALAAAGSLALVFIVSPPDNWDYRKYSEHTEGSLNESALRERIESGIIPPSVTEGEKLVCFYSLRCEFCKMSAKKIATLRSRGEWPEMTAVILFGRGEDTDTTEFLRETGFRPDEIHFIEPEDFLTITNGSMPLILIMDNGEITEKYSYRDIH